MKTNEISFEKALEDLENIVQKLERGELSLEESIDYFQKGIELSKYCNQKLDATEKKISVIVEGEKGEMVEEKLKIEK